MVDLIYCYVMVDDDEEADASGGIDELRCDLCFSALEVLERDAGEDARVEHYERLSLSAE